MDDDESTMDRMHVDILPPMDEAQQPAGEDWDEDEDEVRTFIPGYPSRIWARCWDTTPTEHAGSKGTKDERSNAKGL